MKKRSSLKISVSGTRGIIGESLTPKLLTDFVASFGEYIGGGRVVIGRDLRVSGDMCERAIVAGLLAVGCEPILLGKVPTPTVQVLVKALKANGAIAITASHNPSQWNAMKFITGAGIFFNEIEASNLLTVYNQSDRKYVEEAELKKVRHYENGFSIHQEKIFENIDVDCIKKRKLRVAVDCCNGVGALFTKNFLEALGCEVFTLFDEADGIFRRTPEPIPENLTAICELVKREKCDIGFAQDPDGDRLSIIDDTGRCIGEQYSIVLAAEHVLSQQSGTVVVNIDTTKAIESVAQKYQSSVHYSRVGEINVTTKMLELGACIGGEGGSGGIIYPAVHPCRDSFTGMGLILEMLAKRQVPLSHILSDIPQYYVAKAKIPCSSSDALQIMRRLNEKYAEQTPNTIDGLRLDWEDTWLLLRPSNTEPIIRIVVESRTQKNADKQLRSFVDEVTSEIEKFS